MKPTRLRFVYSKKPERIEEWVNGLFYKIQIYGPPVLDKGKWFLWFAISDDQMKELPGGNLDG
jgi:hypothetical protein